MNFIFDIEKQYLFEKNKAFCEIYRISLCKLIHEKFDINSRQLNVKNVNRLQKVFELKNCLRLNSNNYVYALIFQSLFSKLLKMINEFVNVTVKFSMFDSSIFLRCFHDKYRIKATRQHLALANK